MKSDKYLWKYFIWSLILSLWLQLLNLIIIIIIITFIIILIINYYYFNCIIKYVQKHQNRIEF